MAAKGIKRHAFSYKIVLVAKSQFVLTINFWHRVTQEFCISRKPSAKLEIF
jgi:hypothetical protein